MSTAEFWFRFWGVRGTLPVSGAATLRYGGNTSCVEVHCAGECIILDAGSGIKYLGNAVQAAHMDILLSHTHIDHIFGLPFFPPAYDAARSIRLWAGHLQPENSLQDTLSRFISPPLLPITVNDFKARMEYRDFTAGEEIRTQKWQEKNIRITTLPLSHPDRATGYRLEQGGRVLCYITDYEHIPGTIDEALVRFVRDADYLIYDSTYADEAFERYRGWGHSTWQQAVRLANAAGVKTLIPFHHDPEASDFQLDERAQQLEVLRPGSRMAKENLRIDLMVT